MKLNDRDREMLDRLGTDPCTVEALADRLGTPTSELSARLRDLADNALVYDLGDGQFQRTESGRRVLVASGSDGGAVDNRIDTSEEVERALAELDLPPDEADAVRSAFAFVRYWGDATDDEIMDAIYSEAPANCASQASWWENCVRDPLAELPGINAPAGPGKPWRYAGPAEADTPMSDGFLPTSARGSTRYGSVKHALESLDLSEIQRDAARAAFAYLRQHGEATEDDISADVYPNYPSDYSTADAWWDGFVRDAFTAFPGVSEDDGGVWRYHQRTGSQ